MVRNNLIRRNLLFKALIEVFGNNRLWIRRRVHGCLEQPGELIASQE